MPITLCRNKGSRLLRETESSLQKERGELRSEVQMLQELYDKRLEELQELHSRAEERADSAEAELHKLRLELKLRSTSETEMRSETNSYVRKVGFLRSGDIVSVFDCPLLDSFSFLVQFTRAFPELVALSPPVPTFLKWGYGGRCRFFCCGFFYLSLFLFHVVVLGAAS